MLNIFRSFTLANQIHIMKKILLLLACISCASLHAQEAEIRELIDRLFVALPKADTATLHKCFIPAGQLMTYSFDSKGNPRAKADDLKEFLSAVGNMGPQDMEERLTGWHCMIDDGMATVWTPYEFYFEGQFSHCGVNCFQLIQVQRQWKISLLTDTRRKTGCIDDKKTIAHLDSMINQWHHAAAVADEETFFGMMTADGIYIGTDASERWLRDELREWSKKYFERDKAWDFTPLSRNFQIDSDDKTAWFDELLDTWMGTCRSTGIMKKTDEGWKIVYYHLSIAVPNDNLDGYRKLIGKE